MTTEQKIIPGPHDIRKINVADVEFWRDPEELRRGRINSNHPGIYLEHGGGGSKEVIGGTVLNIGLKRIGFKTAEDYRDVQRVMDEETGIITEYYNVLCCVLDRRVYGLPKPIRETNTYKFDSVEEQTIALELFAKAMSLPRLKEAWMKRQPKPSIIKYTDELLARIEAGEFLA